jgi:hypothetical protein
MEALNLHLTGDIHAIYTNDQPHPTLPTSFKCTRNSCLLLQ